MRPNLVLLAVLLIVGAGILIAWCVSPSGDGMQPIETETPIDTETVATPTDMETEETPTDMATEVTSTTMETLPGATDAEAGGQTGY